MSTVINFATGDGFIYRFRKHFSLNPERVWSNTYEFTANGDGNLDDLLTLAQVLFNFEQPLHLDVIGFDGFLISTWEADSHPYNPAVLYSGILSGAVGTRSTIGSDPVQRNQVLWLGREAATGLPGKLFYRGFLRENDVAAPAGVPILSNASGVFAEVQDAITNSGLVDYLNGGTAKPLRMTMIGKNKGGQKFIRDVDQIGLRGTTTCNINHKWYDLPPRPPTVEEQNPADVVLQVGLPTGVWRSGDYSGDVGGG